MLCCLGDAGRLTYKKSRRGDAAVDRAAMHVLRGLDDHRVIEFSPYGYDERQYCSPGFDLPVGRLSRTPHGEFPEYHTSADDLDFVRPEKLADAFATCLAILDVLEADRIYVSTNPKCEPQLGRRGLYHSIGGLAHSPESEMAMLWVLNLVGRPAQLARRRRALGLALRRGEARRRRAARAQSLLKEAS